MDTGHKIGGAVALENAVAVYYSATVLVNIVLRSRTLVIPGIEYSCPELERLRRDVALDSFAVSLELLVVGIYLLSEYERGSRCPNGSKGSKGFGLGSVGFENSVVVKIFPVIASLSRRIAC